MKKAWQIRLLFGLLLAGLLGACGGGGSPPPPPPGGGGDRAPSYVEAGLLVLPNNLAPQGLPQGETPQAHLLRRALAARALKPGAVGEVGPQALRAYAYLALAWERVPQARGYRLFLRVRPSSSWIPIGEVAGDKTLAKATFTLTFEEGDSLQLGVSALGPWGEGPVTPSPPIEPLAPPVPLSPRDGEDLPGNPLFRWSNSPRAVATGVLVVSKTQEDFAVGRLFEGQVREWRPQNPLPEGAYQWYVFNFRGRTSFQNPELAELFGSFNSWSAASGGEFTIGGALRASISGTIRLVQAGGQAAPPEGLGEALAKLELRQALTQLLQDPPPMWPGRVIVRTRPGLAPQGLRTLRAGEFVLEAERELSLEGVHLYRLRSAPRPLASDPALPLKAALALLDRPEVVWAQPDYVAFAHRVPNDPLYPFNWNYELIGMPRAWDITVGDPRVVVGVVDSGVLWDPLRPQRTHPDLVGQVLAGYDFISDPVLAADGDGRDPDPYDTGPGSLTSYHGSHVGGILGAVGDDGLGIPGVAWRVKQVHARALGPNPQAGTGTGSSVDIAEGILWVAGLPVAGVPPNPYPAQIVNLSLGSTVPCAAHPPLRPGDLPAPGPWGHRNSRCGQRIHGRRRGEPGQLPRGHRRGGGGAQRSPRPLLQLRPHRGGHGSRGLPRREPPQRGSEPGAERHHRRDELRVLTRHLPGHPPRSRSGGPDEEPEAQPYPPGGQEHPPGHRRPHERRGLPQAHGSRVRGRPHQRPRRPAGPGGQAPAPGGGRPPWDPGGRLPGGERRDEVRRPPGHGGPPGHHRFREPLRAP